MTSQAASTSNDPSSWRFRAASASMMLSAATKVTRPAKAHSMTVAQATTVANEERGWNLNSVIERIDLSYVTGLTSFLRTSHPRQQSSGCQSTSVASDEPNPLESCSRLTKEFVKWHPVAPDRLEMIKATMKVG